MCGIFCMFSVNKNLSEKQLTEKFKDYFETLKARGPDSLQSEYLLTEHFTIFFIASVLWLQGKCIKKQPLLKDNSIFVYNGDIFGGDMSNEDRLDQGDTILFLNHIETGVNITAKLSTINGPYAFIYLDINTSKLYFGRDIFGRRSLLLGKNKHDIVLCSVAKRYQEYEFVELPAIGTFMFDLKSKEFHLFPWPFQNKNFQSKFIELQQFLGRNIQVHESNLSENSFYIQNYKVPDEIDLNLFNLLKNIDSTTLFNHLLHDSMWYKNVYKLETFLTNAIKSRISTQPKLCKLCILSNSSCCHATTGVLYSGGIDCAILALLADKFVDKEKPIDLLNVAFDKVKDFKTPDRITGLATLEELQRLCPDRQWNFVEVNVFNSELENARNETIADLIYPLNTILDDSLGCALWFASRGQTENYSSTCRVLLVGMGADELFGGYTRHRASYNRNGWASLHDILIEDWQNLPHRNLARDDRVVAHHGRQLRTPYLDEDVVKFVLNLNVWEKTWPTNEFPQGTGEKILLRSLGYKLGLKNASMFKKRALQFGSRIANPKENAHDISQKLLSK